MKTREEAIVEANQAASDRRRQAATLKAEGLSNPAIARVMGISKTVGVSAEQKVGNLLKSNTVREVLMSESRFRHTRKSGCPRCGREDRPRTVEVIIQARPIPSRKGSLATRSKGMCEICAEEVFKGMEAILDQT